MPDPVLALLLLSVLAWAYARVMQMEAEDDALKWRAEWTEMNDLRAEQIIERNREMLRQQR